MKLLLTALLSLTICTGAKAQSARDYENSINRFKRLYNTKKNDSVFYQLFSERIRNVLPLSKTNEMLHRLYGEFGEVKNFEFIHEDERFRFYKTNFAKGVMTLAVALNPDKKFQSFRFVTYSADAVPK